jgi:ketosteroid isomerase-like protein
VLEKARRVENDGGIMTADVTGELLLLNQRLLDSIAAGDWATYAELCDPTLTAFEPEAKGQLVAGLEFHRFYFNLGGAKRQHNTTMCSPNVRVVGDMAIVAYVRLNQRQDGSGAPVVSAVEETRVWQRSEGRWRHVHFHRSPIPA